VSLSLAPSPPPDPEPRPDPEPGRWRPDREITLMLQVCERAAVACFTESRPPKPRHLRLAR
jgi:hypothetical protein